MRIKTAVGVTSAAFGLGCVIAAGINGLDYNAWTNPGALNRMVQFGGAALILLAVPTSMIIIWFGREFGRAVRRSGLTPGQVTVIGVVGMTAAEYEWARHNERVSERLTESVMGPTERRDPW